MQITDISGKILLVWLETKLDLIISYKMIYDELLLHARIWKRLLLWSSVQCCINTTKWRYRPFPLITWDSWNKLQTSVLWFYQFSFIILLFWAHYMKSTLWKATVHQQPINGISEHFLYKYNYQRGYDPDPIQLHFLHVARIHISVLNYNKIITNGIQRLSYIHAYTKTLHFEIAATGELGKQSLLRHSETPTDLSWLWHFRFFLLLFFLPSDSRKIKKKTFKKPVSMLELTSNSVMAGKRFNGQEIPNLCLSFLMML